MAATDFSSLRDEYDNFLRQEVSMTVARRRTVSSQTSWIEAHNLLCLCSLGFFLHFSLHNCNIPYHTIHNFEFATCSDSIMSIASAP